MYEVMVGSTEGMTQSARRQLHARCVELEMKPIDEASQRELINLKQALQRLDEGTWGECEKCGGAIGRHRLRALPEARTCVDCAG
jgi:RNA polymerase-binding transcription factor DksA